MAQMITAIGRLVRRDDGQDLIEYGLLAALIAIVAMAGVTVLGNTIYTVFWSTLARPSDFIVLATLAAGAGVAAAIDLRTRRVPNPLTAAARGAGRGVRGRRASAACRSARRCSGLVLGLALMLPGHLFGATGAGDVKLFAAAGALLGPAPIVDRLLLYRAGRRRARARRRAATAAAAADARRHRAADRDGCRERRGD